MLLLQVAFALTGLILAANLVLQRPLIESILFSLAIAVGITPQLLPAVVSTGLATGSRKLAWRKVLVKRLVCIADLGDMDVLVTDKTGTLTEGRITFTAALDPTGASSPGVLQLGLLSTETDPTVAGVPPTPSAGTRWIRPCGARRPRAVPPRVTPGAACCPSTTSDA